MRYAAMLILLVLPFTISAKIYKWVDQHGNVHFSDTEKHGSERVKLPPLQSYTSDTPKEEVSADSAQTESAPINYKANITQPEDDATIRNNSGSLAVAVELSPPLSIGHKLVIVVDGQQVGEPQTATSFTLNGINRGTHTIAVEVIDAKNNVLGQSNSVKFNMHRPRVNMIKAKAERIKPAGLSIPLQIVNLVADILLPPSTA